MVHLNKNTLYLHFSLSPNGLITVPVQEPPPNGQASIGGGVVILSSLMFIFFFWSLSVEKHVAMLIVHGGFWRAVMFLF